MVFMENSALMTTLFDPPRVHNRQMGEQGREWMLNDNVGTVSE
jgi:hypothetical protein